MPLLASLGAGAMRAFGFSGWFKARPGQVAFTTPGTYQWTCPPGVYSVCGVAVGAGGTGTSTSWAAANNGGDSYFIDTDTLYAQGGHNNSAGASTAGPAATWVGDGGGNGGVNGTGSWPIGGAGAGGYTGPGGNGSTSAGTGQTAGQGGGGGGGGGASSSTGAGGGGVGIMGQGSNGAADTGSSGGKGGSGGANGGAAVGAGGNFGGGGGSASGDWMGGPGGALAWKNNIPVVPGQTYTIVVGAPGTGPGGKGGNGAVRLIWGDNRAFPSTNTADM